MFSRTLPILTALSLACAQVGWVSVDGVSSTYSLLMPTTPEHSDRISPNGYPIHKVATVYSGCEFSVSSGPVIPSSASRPQEALDRVARGFTELPAGHRGTDLVLIRSTEISLDSVPGRELVILDNVSGGQLQGRVYVFGDQLIQLFTFGRPEECSPDDIERFLESLRFKPAA